MEKTRKFAIEKYYIPKWRNTLETIDKDMEELMSSNEYSTSLYNHLDDMKTTVNDFIDDLDLILESEDKLV